MSFPSDSANASPTCDAGSYGVQVSCPRTSPSSARVGGRPDAGFRRRNHSLQQRSQHREAFADSGLYGRRRHRHGRGDRQAAQRAGAEGRNRAARRPRSAWRAAKVVRTSVYDKTHAYRHRSRSTTAASIVPAQEPEPNPELLTAFDDSPRRWWCAAICRTSMTASTAPPIPTACRRR